MSKPDSLPWTERPDANRLLVQDPLALILGMMLDQQFPMERAFLGPCLLRERLGRDLEAADIASVDPDELAAVFRGPPAIHRFPGSMAKRAQAVRVPGGAISSGDVTRIWADGADGAEVLKRLQELPGYGREKSRDLRGDPRQTPGSATTRLGAAGRRLALHCRRCNVGRHLRTPREEEAGQGSREEPLGGPDTSAAVAVTPTGRVGRQSQCRSPRCRPERPSPRGAIPMPHQTTVPAGVAPRRSEGGSLEIVWTESGMTSSGIPAPERNSIG